ncbi:hypothetical protein HPB49_019275 [Dermacentor silvarum]|uniref:Uncharacterized protein n=1 Tax=Dermacentor silvarum TaxID=543639 RepID=A0ACB8DFE5_DERSI|nr:hypothetical protein HPB49_019275 [Dermacentor silvarum]
MACTDVTDVTSANAGKSSSRKESANTNLFRLPKVVEWQDERTKALSSKRRSLWLARIKRADLKGDLPNIRVCGAHLVDAVTAAPARAFGVGATPPENRYDDGDDDRTYTDSPLKTVEIKTYM